MQPLPLEGVSDQVAGQVPDLYIMALALLSVIVVGAGLLAAFLRHNRTLARDRAAAEEKRDSRWMEFLAQTRENSRRISDTCHEEQRDLATGYAAALQDSAQAIRAVESRMAAHDEVNRSTVAVLERVHTVLDRNGVTRCPLADGSVKVVHQDKEVDDGT